MNSDTLELLMSMTNSLTPLQDLHQLNSSLSPAAPRFQEYRHHPRDLEALEHVAYLTKVGKSRKLANFEHNGNGGCTIGEIVLLEQQFSHADILPPINTSALSLTGCLSHRPSFWSFILAPKTDGNGVKGHQSSCCDRGDIVSCVQTDRGNFCCCPPEVNYLIFDYLSPSEILRCRLICRAWYTQINFFFGFTSVLNSFKVYRFKTRLKKPLPFEIHHYDLSEFTRHLKHKHFLRLPEPRSVRILKRMSSKNFLKMMDCWRGIESLTIFLEPLISTGLFQKWSYYYPLEYFPNLNQLTLHLDRLHLARYKSFNPKQLRFNLDQILISPYTKLENFSFRMLNSGRHYACAFLAPILMFIGRQYQSLRRIEVVFQTGYELEFLSSGYSSEQHAPCHYVPLDDQIYVHGEVNLNLVSHARLSHISLAVPAIVGCTTRSGICNYFSKLLDAQRDCLQSVLIETQVGLNIPLVRSITSKNKVTLREIEVTVVVPSGDVLDMGIFGACASLRALRVKRVGFNDLPCHMSQLSNVDHLPHSLKKVSLERFFLSVMDLFWLLAGGRKMNNDMINDERELECVQVCSSYIIHGNVLREEERICDETLTRMLLHPHLKYVCFSPIQRNTLNKVLHKLKTTEAFRRMVEVGGWQWTVLTREFWLAKPRRLILYRGDEHLTKSWFNPYYFEKIKV